MSDYLVKIKKSATKELQKIKRSNAQIANNIRQAINGLKSNPRPNGCKKLNGETDSYRIKIGQHYRIIYSVYDQELIVRIIRITSRENAYKRL